MTTTADAWGIGEVAAKVGLTEHTLRWYERIGLLDRIDRGSDRRRRFSPHDVDWILLLTRLRQTGMSVADMQRYAGLVRSGAGERERLELLIEHRERVRAGLIAQQECLEMLDHKITTYRRAVGPAPKETS